MIRNFTKALLLIFLAVFTICSFKFGVSTGAPPSSTGAPDEHTCAVAGCHDTYDINSGTASLSLDIEGIGSGYVPGETYPLKIKIADPDVIRFGFELVALTSQNKNAGTFEITDWDRTQVLWNDLKLTDRQYLTYTFNGTEALETGATDWEVNWIAPDEEGAISFYLAAVSANNDATDDGDFVFTEKIEINSSSSTSVFNNSENIFYLNVFPNPIRDISTLKLVLPSAGKLKIDLIDINGKVLSQIYKGYKSSGNNEINFQLSPNIENGVYFLKVKKGKEQYNKKVFVYR